MTNGEKFKDVFGFGADGSRIIAVNSTWWDCVFQIRKPKTNADRIRSMSDEELAELFADNNCGYCRIPDFCFAKGCQINCEDAWLDWLKKESEEGE